jgi:hypothetical protein
MHTLVMLVEILESLSLMRVVHASTLANVKQVVLPKR